MAKPQHDKPERGQSGGEKYVPVPVDPRPAAAAEVEAHLRAFITAFISTRSRPRWEHCLLVAPKKARGHLQHFRRDHDPAHCRELRGAAGFPLRLAGIYGSQVGIYFTGHANPLQVTAAEAATLATEHFADAVFSLVPGKLALYFDHDGGVWACEH
ncbi:MAG: hypothetical protein K0Q72_3391 [Armatimonadetes bacterium]|jgi:hypothetical protein|nr:hypothetical protein [Armatimonadota bacterium]